MDFLFLILLEQIHHRLQNISFDVTQPWQTAPGLGSSNQIQMDVVLRELSHLFAHDLTFQTFVNNMMAQGW